MQLTKDGASRLLSFDFLRRLSPNAINNEDKIMKKSIFAFAGLLLLLSTFLSTAVFAEEHALAAIEHTSAAIAKGKVDKAPALVEHAQQALEHAKQAENVALGHSKTQMQSAVKELEKAIDAGKTGDSKKATESAEAALGFLQAGNK
jgi:ribosomal protein S20